MKPEPVLTHMPLHIQLKIADLMNTVTKLSSLRRCSKHFQNIVDNSKTHYPSITMDVVGRSFIVILIADETHEKKTSFHLDESDVNHLKRLWDGTEELKKGHYYLAGLKHFEEIMSNSKISVGSFKAYLSRNIHIQRFWRDWQTVFRSIQRKFCVERIVINCTHQRTISLMLTVLQPGFLKTIVLKKRHLQEPFCLDQVVELEQWKSAVELDASKMLTEGNWPCSHFETLSLRLTHLSLQAVKSAVQIFLDNSNKKSTRILCSTADNDAILAYLGQIEKVENEHFIPIPGSEDSLEVSFSQEPSFMFTVKRVKRN